MTTEPRRYGRANPVALRGLAESVQHRLERDLRAAAALDNGVFVRAYWLRAETAGPLRPFVYAVVT